MADILDADGSPSKERFPRSDPNSARALGRAAVAVALPGVGTIALAVIDEIFKPVLDRARADFIDDLALRVHRLEQERGISPDELRSNPQFQEAFGTAIRVAMFTQQQEKRAALRNAVLNSALPSSPDALEQQVFLGMIERFTELHILVLKMLRAPDDWRARRPAGARSANTPRELLLEAFPDLRGREFLSDQVWSELLSAHLVEGAQSLDNWGEGSSVSRKRTTAFADRFLNFIESPLVE